MNINKTFFTENFHFVIYEHLDRKLIPTTSIACAKNELPLKYYNINTGEYLPQINKIVHEFIEQDRVREMLDKAAKEYHEYYHNKNI